MIGIFDSGIGGLTVVRELFAKSPHASFVYLGDTARTPYGNKTVSAIRAYAREDADFLVSHGATSIVIACNTVSANAADVVRDAYPNIPVYEVIVPAVDDALAATRGCVGVIGTRATIGSGKYQSLLSVRLDLKVIAQSCPLFVPLAEEGWFDGPATDAVIASYLEPLRSQGVDTLILGCTHYPLLKKSIQRFMGPDVRLIDSAESVVSRLVADGLADDGEQTYFFTDLAQHSQAVAEQWLERKLVIQKGTLS